MPVVSVRVLVHYHLYPTDRGHEDIHLASHGYFGPGRGCEQSRLCGIPWSEFASFCKRHSYGNFVGGGFREYKSSCSSHSLGEIADHEQKTLK